nr:hypothetical protein [Tanacetum cinerariifolium]
EGTGTIPGVPNVPIDEFEEDISWKSTDDEGDDDEGNDDDGEKEDGDGDDDDEDDDGEEGNDDDDDQEDEGNDDDDEEEGNGEENFGLNVGREEGHDEEEEEDELYRDVNINQGMGIHTTQKVEDSHVTLTPVNPDGMESIFETTSQMDAHNPTSVAPLPMYAPTLTPFTIATITTTQQAPLPPTTALSTLLQDLPNFGSLFGFDHQLKTLEANISEFSQTNQFAGAVSAILGIVQRYMDHLADKAILSGADSRPPMLEKDMYDSWKSRMELYILNRQYGRMILESVKNGPLLWQIVEENGVTKTKTYSELSATESIQADCDVKVTNIILQGLPPDVYALYASQAPSLTPLLITYPVNDFQSSVNHMFFQKGDDPIDAINHMMSFLTAIVTSRYPPTNNQLRTLSNPRQQATINNGRDKVLLVQAQANGQVLHEEELEFLADPGIAETQST